MTDLDFDAGGIEPTGKFEPVPIDDYLAIITESEMKDTKPKPNKEPGKYLHLVFEIIDGEYKGRKIFTQLNLVNTNQTTVDIAQRSLSAICRAVDVMSPKKSEELHGKPLVISVGIRAADGAYDASNIVKGYARVDGKELKDITGGDSAAGKPAATTSAGVKKKPWEKK